MGRRGLVGEDRRDIEQELAAQLWRAQQRYDPSRASPETFATRVVDNQAANILAERKAAKRDAGPAAQRQRDEKDADDETAEVIDISDMLAAERYRQHQEILRSDLAKAMGQLPEKHRDLCRRLIAGTIADAVNDTQTPRSTLYGQIAETRRHFERAGLRRYLNADVFRRVPVGTPQTGRARRR